MTLCKHYFCETCALKNFVDDQKCFICGAETKGSFNTAADIEAKMKKIKQSTSLEGDIINPKEAAPSEDDDAVWDKFNRQQKRAKENRF